MSPVPDSLAWAVDAINLLWEDLDSYVFPPVAGLGKVVAKLKDCPCSLATRTSTIREKDFFETMAARIEAPQRGST